MLGAQWVGGADARALKSLTKQSPQVLGFTQFDQTAKRPVGIGGRSVDEETGLVFVAVDLAVDSFANAGGVVTAF